MVITEQQDQRVIAKDITTAAIEEFLWWALLNFHYQCEAGKCRTLEM